MVSPLRWLAFAPLALVLFSIPVPVRAQTSVEFDTDRVFPCREVPPPENADTARKVIVIAIPVSANFQGDESSVETIRYEFRLPPSMKIRDHLPKTQTEASVRAQLERRVEDARGEVWVEYGGDGRIGFSLWGADVELDEGASKKTNDQRQVKTDIQVDRLPPREQVIVAGTMNERRTLYFDLKWHTQTTRAGTKDYAILAEVDEGWTDDAVTLVCVARRDGEEISRYHKAIGLHLTGDRQAERRALEKARSIAEVVTNSVGMSMRLIPSGTFPRGSEDGDEDADSDEKPLREITISQAFRLSAHEVTQGQYRQVMGDKNPSRFKASDDLPVENVSWFDAVTFCNRLSEMEGKRPCYRIVGESVTILPNGDGYRLPTEAEWEYACRGGSRTKWFFGDAADRLGDFAWFKGNAESKTHPVGRKRPNGFGLYDMLGNVWEWCQDSYDSSYYKKSPEVDPPGPAGASPRVNRGGSRDILPARCRPANRGRIAPESRIYFLGFRVAAVQAG
ncbi:MAG: formylglycine-generating enzyme family protein [Isosphaeraceae bacterium]